MTNDERLLTMKRMLGEEDSNSNIFEDYLLQAREKILNHRYPFGNGRPNDVEPQYHYEQVELAIVLYNQRGGEGQKSHNENGIQRTWRTEHEILKGIPQVADTSFL